MKAFNRANEYLRMLLIEEAIFPIDLDDIKVDGWLYQSEFPFELSTPKSVTKYHFRIRLYQYDSKTKSLKLQYWKYKSAPGANLVYADNQDLDASANQMGRDFIESERFKIIVMPVLLEGFREIAFQSLLDSE